MRSALLEPPRPHPAAGRGWCGDARPDALDHLPPRRLRVSWPLVLLLLLGARWIWAGTHERRGVPGVAVAERSIPAGRALAGRPADWLPSDGDPARGRLLWAGPDPVTLEPRWFRVGPGELEWGRLTPPFGRDVVAPLDGPRHVAADDLRPAALPPETPLRVACWNGERVAYPVALLERAWVVNDHVGGHPLLLTFRPTEGRGAVAAFCPMLDGVALSFSTSGTFLDGRPLLYDRSTESQWVARPAGLACVAGPLRGEVLPEVETPALTTWDDWDARRDGGWLALGPERAERVSPR